MVQHVSHSEKLDNITRVPIPNWYVSVGDCMKMFIIVYLERERDVTPKAYPARSFA